MVQLIPNQATHSKRCTIKKNLSFFKKNVDKFQFHGSLIAFNISIQFMLSIAYVVGVLLFFFLSLSCVVYHPFTLLIALPNGNRCQADSQRLITAYLPNSGDSMELIYNHGHPNDIWLAIVMDRRLSQTK